MIKKIIKISLKKLKYPAIIALTVIILAAAWFFYWSFGAKKELLAAYQGRQSVLISDRNGRTLAIKPNADGYYARYSKNLPENFSRLLLKKEDKYFYFHPGFNPFSILRATINYLQKNNRYSSSTITQQLAKILLKNESRRGIKNKIQETFYALALEAHFSKKEILKMYADSAYFGNHAQGLEIASRLYFNSSSESLADEEIIQLLATLSNPSNANPFEIENLSSAQNLYRRVGVRIEKNKALADKKNLEKDFASFVKSPQYFEIETMKINCQSDCQLTIDEELTKKIRAIVKKNLEILADKQVDNAAAVVIKTSPSGNELLAVVGSPDPTVDAYGYKINMASRPRAIGSTVKPFIYLKGFAKGLRPYSRVEDREYKYAIGSGYALYPRNYDYTYHGNVDLHFALSNSLNVPTVKVLEYVGLENFYDFLEKDLSFKPLNDLSTYQLGIALGGLDMDLATLSYYFTIFPNKGQLLPLRVCPDSACGLSGMADFSKNISAGREEDVQLVTKIISDRQTGVEQFGAKSDLNLPFENYAVKTGTSRDWHDSWTVGYTPSFVVGAWVGNGNDAPMDEVSGSIGGGRVWHEVMQLLYNSDYNRGGNFDFSKIKEYRDGGNLTFGLAGDNIEQAKNLLLENNLILSPHNSDTFLLEKNMAIILKSRTKASWSANGKIIGQGTEIIFRPSEAGTYVIKASNLSAPPAGQAEEVKIFVKQDK